MIVGVDVGGTKTHIRVVDAEGRTRDLRVSTASWLEGRSLEHPTSVEGLLAAIARLEPAAGAAPLAVGAHGCDTPAQISAFRAALAARRPGDVLVTNDAALVGPAAGVERAIGVIAGTGSIVVGADAATRPVTAGGHGWLLADPGSAPGIVREAVIAVLEDADAGGSGDRLGPALMAHYSAASANDLAWVLTAQAGIHRWAEAAPLVFDAADGGSAVAATVIQRAGAALGRQVAQVLRRGAVADAVVAAGGVVTNQPRLACAIEAELRRRDVRLPFRVLDTPPVAGAIALGARLEHTGAPSIHPWMTDQRRQK
ncbi:BadF/BadG/BcrA/BcrD ATPase family protein [Microbacterium sp.]|uniref:BadF/BadG/BcrA/BcrD ATPase family protein n=1 Tax=Microbacterium sp. TaxID=51671 RepID=UPI0028120F47|nr:BadF/BadG/BcrA/BcrD ATPase family protein [Microbacterium sp.]